MWDQSPLAAGATEHNMSHVAQGEEDEPSVLTAQCEGPSQGSASPLERERHISEPPPSEHDTPPPSRGTLDPSPKSESEPATVEEQEQDAMESSTSLLASLMQAVVCPVCDKPFSQPTTLECGHSFCMSCVLSTLSEAETEAEATATSNATSTNTSTPSCPLATCTFQPPSALEKVLTQSGQIYQRDPIKHVDVALHKVMHILTAWQESVAEQHRLSRRSSHTSVTEPAEELKDGTDNCKRGRISVASTTHKRKRLDPVTGNERSFAQDVLSELECQVCFASFAEPVTTLCGHTYCRHCLARSLDHSDKCPLCRSLLPAYSYFVHHPPNATLLLLLKTGFPDVYQDRLEAMTREEADPSLNTPIFVCTLAFPHTPTFLHVFEPRYRLMMRRVMERDRRFGMVLPTQSGGDMHPYGTMLEITNFTLLPDGRSMIETMGVSRFKMIKTGTLDGYTVARVEPIVDISEEEEVEMELTDIERSTRLHVQRAERLAAGASLQDVGPEVAMERTTEDLIATCRQFLDVLRTDAAPWMRQKLNDTLGPPPEGAAQFSFYMAAMMPFYEYEKVQILPMTSPRQRLKLLVFWIEQLRGSWWFNRGCSIM